MTIEKLIHITDKLYQYSINKINFDSDGWPIFKEEYFVDEWPQDMITFDNRNSKLVLSKEKTLICFFMGDCQNFRRFKNLLNDIPIYQEYLGVVIPDITVTCDMDLEMQKLIMLANQLFATILISNNIKIVFNTRNGIQSTTQCFRNIPRHIICASSFLGCRSTKNVFEASPYINKILGLMPDKLLIYGKHDLSVDSQLELLGINYRYYPDFHSRCKNASKLIRRCL